MKKEAKVIRQTDGKDHVWDAVQDQVESDTKLEHDEGYGGAAIIRRFTYGANPLAFKEHLPTQQELFNSHLKQIEIQLWKDGMKLMTDVTPRVRINDKKDGYEIIVGAKPQKGHLLTKTPNLLRDFTHAPRTR